MVMRRQRDGGRDEMSSDADWPWLAPALPAEAAVVVPMRRSPAKIDPVVLGRAIRVGLRRRDVVAIDVLEQQHFPDSMSTSLDKTHLAGEAFRILESAK
jgi:hypothetical protein